MCVGCWEEYGSPMIVSPKTVHASHLIKRVYDHSGVGGQMHVQLDDWNIDDEHFEPDFSPDNIGGDERYSKMAMAVFRECFAYMRELSVAERASALAYHEGFFDFDHRTQVRKCDGCAPEPF